MSKVKEKPSDFQYIKTGLENIVKEHKIMIQTFKAMRDDLKQLDLDIELIKCGPLIGNAHKLKEQILQQKDALKKQMTLTKEDITYFRSIAHKIKKVDKI